jgi:RNA polymerase sigma-70 factor (ECF subfamily)
MIWRTAAGHSPGTQLALLTQTGRQLKERTMSSARAIPHWQRNGRARAYDAGTFISDERLVALAKMGNGTVFNELHRRHAGKVFRVAHRIIRHREDAEDAVQESFISAYVHLHTFDGRAKFSTWLTRIVINAALMKVRKHRPARQIPIENGTEALNPYLQHEFRDFSPNPEEICAKAEHQAALRKAIAELRPSLRNVVELYQLQECSMDETAKILGISVGAAKTRLFHARASLRRNKALLRNHKAARHVSRKRFSCGISCTAPFAQ